MRYICMFLHCGTGADGSHMWKQSFFELGTTEALQDVIGRNHEVSGRASDIDVDWSKDYCASLRVGKSEVTL